MGRIRSALSELVPTAGPDPVPPGWVRPAPDARMRRLDVTVAVLLAAGGALGVALARVAGLDSAAHPPSIAEGTGWCLAVSLPLALRTRYPQVILVVVAAAFIGLQARGVPEGLTTQISLFLAVFTVGAWARERVIARWTRGVVVAAMFAFLILRLSTYAWDRFLTQRHPHGPVSAVVAVVVLTGVLNVVYFAAAWAFGDLAWRAAGQRALLERRNAELARERDENARRAVLDERVRIARELHDVVAHHVSVMGVQAGAARVVLDADADAARTALGGIEQAARSALDEMHRLLGVLRAPADGREDRPEPDRAAAPVPTLPGIQALVDGVASSGVRARFTIVGESVPVPSGLVVSVYRIAQEALTNTLRHAGAARVDVRLRYLTGPPALEVEIVDDGRSPVAQPAGGRRGLGLVGMRERAALHGGDLEVGPRPDGGFRVRVRFPLPAERAAAAGGPGRPAPAPATGRAS
ncbi:MAG TPA: histidine kinase [Kineosporiaceae bacterium]